MYPDRLTIEILPDYLYVTLPSKFVKFTKKKSTSFRLHVNLTLDSSSAVKHVISLSNIYPCLVKQTGDYNQDK